MRAVLIAEIYQEYWHVIGVVALMGHISLSARAPNDKLMSGSVII